MRAAVMIPTLNEEAHIEPLLRGLLDISPTLVPLIIVADGGSSDLTRALVSRVSRQDVRVRLLDNPKRIQAAGCNLAAAACGADIQALVRMDAHSTYPSDYVPCLLAAMERTGADSVVVRLTSRGEGCFQRAAATASNSKLGTGGSAHRVGGSSAWIDHGHHAAFSLKRYVDLGGYDETFPANEDAEFDMRLRRAGGRIWFEAGLEVGYWPRRTPLALARQYFRYGLGRAKTVRKSRERPKPRQLVPPGVLVSCVLSIIAGVALPIFWFVPLAYFVSACIYGAVLGLKARDRCGALSGVCAIIMHLSWGAGFLVGCVSAIV